VRVAKSALAFLLFCGLCACGTYVPDLRDWPNNSYGGSVALINSIVHSVRCELSHAVTNVVSTDVAASRLRRSHRAYTDFLNNWGAQVAFTFTISEMSAVNPTAVWMPPSPLTTIFTLGGEATVSSQATRVEKLNFFYTVKDLYLRDGQICDASGADPSGSLLIRNDLKIGELLDARLLPAVAGNASTPDNGDENVLSHEITFEVVSSGGITPTWQLTRATINGSGTLLSSNRDRTHDLVITFGPLDKPLTPTDLSELEKMLLDAGIGEAGDIETSKGFGRFVRSMVGLDRTAVRDAFGEFLAAGVATANQIEFINMVIEHLTDQGVMDPALLYEPPFTDVAPTGPDQLFGEERVTRLFSKIEAINASAVA
jgi:hypothetical protein